LKADEANESVVDMSRVVALRSGQTCFTPLQLTTSPNALRDAAVHEASAPSLRPDPRPLNVFKSVVVRLGLAGVGWAGRLLRWAYASVGIVDFGCRGRCVVSARLSGDSSTQCSRTCKWRCGYRGLRQIAVVGLIDRRASEGLERFRGGSRRLFAWPEL